MTDIKEHPAYHYAKDVMSGKEVANNYLKTACKRFLKEIDNGKECTYKHRKKSTTYVFDEIELKKLTVVLGFLRMATGTKKGEPVDKSLVGFQWFFLTNIFCWKHKEDLNLRRYKLATLLIGRKNSKTFMSALIFIYLLLTEPSFSELYSVAPDKELSKQIKRQMDAIIKSSPAIVDKFKISQREVYCIPTNNKYMPLANSNDRLDGREPTAWLGDESGALKNRYPLDAMASGQTTIPNSLGIIISTAYNTLENPMTSEVQKAKDKLKGKHYDPTYFSMLYCPDVEHNWDKDVNEMWKCNPLAQHVEEIENDLLDKRSEAILYEGPRDNFLTKFMNIFIDGDAGEQFVSRNELIKGQLKQPYDWQGKEVMVGLDFAQSGDNFGISMVAYDDVKQGYVTKSWAIYAKGREQSKTKAEEVDYAKYAKKGWVIPSGDETIDYGDAEEFVLNLEQEYGVHIVQIGYDRWQALSSIAKFEGMNYECVEVPQDNRHIYPPTKFLREQIKTGNFFFEKNDFYVSNYTNATMITDNHMNYYLNKKKSNGRIDMTASTIDAMALWLNKRVEEIEGQNAGVYSL